MTEHLDEIWVRGYRSIRDVRLELAPLTIVVGPNGVGKTNLYRAIQALANTTQRDFLQSVALEGGMQSMHWAGDRKNKEPVRLVFGASWPDLSVELALGLPSPTGERENAFVLDPEVKEECIWPAQATPRSWLYRRRGALVASQTDGAPIEYPGWMQPWEVGLGEIREPAVFPEVEVVRQRLESWRFYHQFRSDAESPLRRAQVGFRSPVLDGDGGNLVAALQTIRQIGDAEVLSGAVAEVFEGGSVAIDHSRPEFELSVSVPHLRRPLAATELSDGQLRFLCLAAALLSPRPPGLFVLNEPESSLHDGTLAALAKLIARASVDSQLIVTTHSSRLVEELQRRVEARVVTLARDGGATVTGGQ